MTLQIKVNKKHTCNIAFINVISKVFISIVVVKDTTTILIMTLLIMTLLIMTLLVVCVCTCNNE